MRAKFVFEKFTEEGDPIRDMGIGLKAKLDKLVSSNYSLKWERPEAKDYERIRSIVAKSKGNHEKENMYARNMCKAIQDRWKAYRRYLAAKELGGEDWDVTMIFLENALKVWGVV